MKKVIIILNLVFLIFSTACNNSEDFNDIINSFDTENKIFVNVISEDKVILPFFKEGEPIIWNYDEDILSLKENILEVKKDGFTILSANYLGKNHIYSIKIQNSKITNTVQYNLNFYYSYIDDDKKIGQAINPDKIIVHNTANTASAKNEIKWLNNKDNTSSTSFHYAVDDTGIYQAISTTNAAYHAGDLSINNKSIGIEIAKSMIDDIYIKNKCIDNATLLIVLLMNFYDIKIDDVLTHYDSSGKYCPHDIFERYGIDEFYKKIKDLL